MKRLLFILIVSLFAVNCNDPVCCKQEKPVLEAQGLTDKRVNVIWGNLDCDYTLLYINGERDGFNEPDVIGYAGSHNPGDTTVYVLRNYGPCYMTESDPLVVIAPVPVSYTATWDENVELDLAGYKLFLNDSLIYDGINTSFKFDTIDDTVCCYVKAYDRSGNISEPSEVVCAVDDL